MLTFERMIEVLEFDPINGMVFFRKNNKRAGTFSKERGYRCICIDYKIYKEHRLMWFYVHGKWPKWIDHINCKKDDNRICNLREANHSQNQCNKPKSSVNSSGFKNVNFHKRWKKWQVRIGLNRKRIHIGYFKTKEEAYTAYCSVVKKYHGDFARIA